MSVVSDAITVSALTIYPIKSTKGLSLASMTFDAIGPDGDRRWMIVDSKNHFLTQRQQPHMCLIESVFISQGLLLRAPGCEELVVEYRAQGDTSKVEVWGDWVTALDCGDAAARWVSDYLQQPCRLVQLPENSRRQIDADYVPQDKKTESLVSFADGFPLLLTSEASLADLNQRLTVPIGMDRFRPNIVVSGCGPYIEDGWKRLRIGDLEMVVVKPCSRCVIPSIDPQTAQKQSEVVKVLASYRRRDGAVYFGQNVLHHQTGEIKVGDHVQILE